jgi:PAS domain S-box-containing protein
MSLFAGQGHEKPFTRVCDLHTQVIPDESYSAFARTEVRQRAVSLFQQKALALDVEIAKHRATEQRLHSSEERYRRLFETSTDGILMVDPYSGLILDTNPFMLRLLGLTHGRVVDKQLWQVGLMPDQSSQQVFFQRMLQEREQSAEITRFSRKDGRVRSIEWVSTVFQVNGQAMLQCHVRDVTERLQAEESLLYLAAIVSSSNDAILSKDLSGAITSWNEAAERIFGYSAQEIVGRTIAHLFSSEQQNEFMQIMDHIEQGESVERYETRLQCKDGNLLPVSITVSPIKNRDGTLIGASMIVRDISEHMELEQQREAFLNMVSHELKTPMTALQAALQLAQRRVTRMLNQTGLLTAEHHRWLEDVLVILIRTQQPLRTLQRLTNDLLDISRIWRDKIELHFATFNLMGLVNEIVQDYQAVHADRIITLNLPQQELIPVYADRDRIQQVLGHYLSNALKFAPTGLPIQVCVGLEDRNVRIQVRDQGPGISPEQQKRIWKRYYRVPDIPIQDGWKEGLGLGLHICQELIHRQQGEVGVESSSGHGAIFWFTLPILLD